MKYISQKCGAKQFGSNIMILMSIRTLAEFQYKPKIMLLP